MKKIIILLLACIQLSTAYADKLIIPMDATQKKSLKSLWHSLLCARAGEGSRVVIKLTKGRLASSWNDYENIRARVPAKRSFILQL